jgi:hypothetical protein
VTFREETGHRSSTANAEQAAAEELSARAARYFSADTTRRDVARAAPLSRVGLRGWAGRTHHPSAVGGRGGWDFAHRTPRLDPTGQLLTDVGRVEQTTLAVGDALQLARDALEQSMSLGTVRPLVTIRHVASVQQAYREAALSLSYTSPSRPIVSLDDLSSLECALRPPPPRP